MKPDSPSLPLRTHPRRAWLAAVAAATLAAVGARRAGAQGAAAAGAASAPDGGPWTIVLAAWGTGEREVDVTELLRERLQRERRLVVGNAAFAVDPVPGRPKRLRVFARNSAGWLRSADFAEGSEVDSARLGMLPPAAAASWRIVAAYWGTAARHVDVTQRLREIARADERFTLGNDTFGQDPDFGRVKTLRIHTRDGAGRLRTFDHAEGALVDGAQFSDWRGGSWAAENATPPPWGAQPGLAILSASYGAGGQRIDLRDVLQRRVTGQQRLDVRVDNTLSGRDPAPGQRKMLNVSFSNEGGPAITRSVAENSRLLLP
jgi:hypothetical protein